MAKSKYETHVKPNLFLVESWARNGLIDKQIANNLGISETTFHEYKKKYVEFSDTLKKGKEVVDFEVENALFKRAIGYEYEEITHEYGEETKRVTKQMPADTTAAIFWLKNRKPVEWANRDNKLKEKQIETTIDKTKAEIEFIKERIKLLKGVEKDTTLLQTLIDTIKE